MFEGDQNVDVATLPKFDMPLYEPEMTAKDVKSLAIQNGIPLDLHTVALTKGWTMDHLPDDMIGLYEQIEPVNYVRAVLSKSRHHDFDVNDSIPKDGFNASDVQLLTERVVDLRPMPPGLLFSGGLATTLDFLGFRPFLKIPRGMPLRAMGPTGPATENPSGAAADTVESREDRSLYITSHDLANRSVHDDGGVRDDEKTNSLRLGSFVDHSGRNLTLVQTEVFQSSPGDHSVHCSPSVKKAASPTRFPLRGARVNERESSRNQAYYVPVEWSIRQRCHVDTPMWCREPMVHLAPHPFKRSQMPLPTQPPLRGLADYDQLAETHSKCRKTFMKLVQERSDLEHNANLYINMTDRELEDELARKDSALVYAERINAERAQEKEKLSHKCKQSLSEPFNLAIQAGWAKRLAEERFEEDLSQSMSRMKGFYAYADKKMFFKYDKLFEKRYPFVKKISHGFCHTVSDLIKVYPDSLHTEQAPPSKPSSGKASSFSVPNNP
uniref:Uncharacterized protein n=1 Tax=Tanacetum cinerariifolium TaxID=118510 RepID=A0A699H778_TANCI|nr:hypothetical protein [Tanacetum cinerariifolium]